MTSSSLTFILNGRETTTTVEDWETVLDVLHQKLGMPDVRYGCGEGACGTCTVLLDGDPVSACLMFAVQVRQRQVQTLAGLANEDGDLHPLQRSFLKHGGAQCGFCTAGIILTSSAFVGRCSARPTRDEIRHELVGNLCRCTGYNGIVDAVEEYAAKTVPESQGVARGDAT